MKAAVCYTYLTDVAQDGSIAKCRWFTRGWTLQELIAPTFVEFYNQRWEYISDKISMSSRLATITGIDESLLRCGHARYPVLFDHHKMNSESECSCQGLFFDDRVPQLRAYSVAQRMSWASLRETTRGEDIAYCLMGLFEVNMPLLYGEGGSKAFLRLQKEILQNTHDQSILAGNHSHADGRTTALARQPNEFLLGGGIRLMPIFTKFAEGVTPYPVTMSLTKFGVTVELLTVLESKGDFKPAICFGILDCQVGENSLGRLAIPLHSINFTDSSSIFCLREPGLFVISPGHQYARDLQVLTGRKPLTECPDRKKYSVCRHHKVDM